MPVICLIGAGSTIRLFDIDPVKLDLSRRLMEKLNEKLGSHATIEATTNREDALRGADYVFNTIAVGSYDPYIKADFKIPQKYGLEQTAADTLGIGGLFRGLRAIPVCWILPASWSDCALTPGCSTTQIPWLSSPAQCRRP